MVLSLTILDLGIQILSSCSSRWHRIAYSVQGKSVTLYVDCQKIETQSLQRGEDAAVSTDGVTVFGNRLPDKAVFEVGCQQCLRGFDYHNQALAFAQCFLNYMDSKFEMGWLPLMNCGLYNICMYLS